MIAQCSCGRTEYQLEGRPIVSLICFCGDCQVGSQKLEALPGAGPVRDTDGGTAYVVYRKDRVRCTRGAELLETHRLREGSTTGRVAASCCNSPMVLWFDDAKHWTPVFRARLTEPAPPEMRICSRLAKSPLDAEIPNHQGYPPKLYGKLLAARLAMLFRR